MIFGILSFMIYDDFINTDFGMRGCRETTKYQHGGYNKESSYTGIGLHVACVCAIVAIYHQNWLIGVLTVMMIFFTFGFLFGVMCGGYYIGFVDSDYIERCLIVSLLLNGFMIGTASGLITGNILEYSKIFETGVYFVGSFVGSIAMLILSDEYYIMRKKNYNIGVFLLMQMLMGLYCFGMMYFGNILNITSYKSIGGTFFVLWGLSIERTVLQKLGTNYMTIILGIVLVNLWFVKQLINWYPEYCIF
jgi:hypothetical protein